jgi:hypothetical protein
MNWDGVSIPYDFIIHTQDQQLVDGSDAGIWRMIRLH